MLVRGREGGRERERERRGKEEGGGMQQAELHRHCERDF